MRSRILDQPIDIVNKEEALRRSKMALVNSRQFKIITLNSEMVISAEKNIEFQAAINNASLIIPDGTGITWALKLLDNTKFQEIERVPGIELAEQILESANELDKKVAVFGGKKESLEKAIVKIREKYPNIQIVKAIDGYQGKERDKEIALEIASLNPDVVLIALGSPAQEIWMNKFSSLFPESIMIGIGGSLDVWSGKKKRAPQWMRNYNLEWLYRVISEPRRVPRVMRSLPVFMWRVITSIKSRQIQDYLRTARH